MVTLHTLGQPLLIRKYWFGDCLILPFFLSFFLLLLFFFLFFFVRRSRGKMTNTFWVCTAGIACWLERWSHDQKVVSSNPSRSGRRFFFSRVNFVCWLSFGVSSTPLLLQWHVKDPSHSAKSAGGRLHLNMHTPLTQRSWSGLTMLLSRHSAGIYQEMSSHATHQGTLSHNHLSSLSHCGLILANLHSKKNK